MDSIESTVLSHMLYNERYARQVLPFVKPEYFQDSIDKIIYTAISDFFIKYNTLPTTEALVIDLDNTPSLSEDEHEGAESIIKRMKEPLEVDHQWLLDNTEKFCKDKAIYNGIMESIAILDDDKGDKSAGAIPDILSEALAVCFDTHIGHDWLEDHEQRFDFYHETVEKIPFNIEYLNKITRGGLPKKTLNVILAGTGVGKTLAMTHMAGANLLDGYNVLYITLEMAEEKISERIDANLLNVKLDDLEKLSKKEYTKKIARIQQKTQGKLIVKEYPTASAGAGHFRHLMNELKIKRNFVPDIVYIDYINICTSTRIKNNQANSYTIVKSIAEEFRGLAVEKEVPIVTATQVTRSGFDSSDIELTDTSESWGLPQTADWMVAMISTEELIELGQVMFKQLKNRYGDVDKWKRFVVGIEKAKMRLYDCDQTAQEDIQDDKPVMDNTDYGGRADEEDKMSWMTKKAGRKDFSGFS